jgi:predicted nuclease of predicted toxin-antitoxin system
VGDRGWVVLTKDEAIAKNQLELMAIARAEVKVFILSSGNLTRQDMADLFIEVLEKMKKFAQGNQAPFIAKVSKDRRVELWKTRTQLFKMRS